MPQPKSAIKTCLACDKPIKGRSDKKFCDDSCRNNYNNELKSISNNQMRNVNNALGKNRRILEELLPEGKEIVKTTKEKLLQKGFLFKYITNIYTTKEGKVYYYCYDYGYLPLDNDWYLIVRRKEE
jgi:predicted nucleic acid-binding Zn ribbon protein